MQKKPKTITTAAVAGQQPWVTLMAVSNGAATGRPVGWLLEAAVT